jgi:hypothetical protein
MEQSSECRTTALCQSVCAAWSEHTVLACKMLLNFVAPHGQPRGKFDKGLDDCMTATVQRATGVGCRWPAPPLVGVVAGGCRKLPSVKWLESWLWSNSNLCDKPKPFANRRETWSTLTLPSPTRSHKQTWACGLLVLGLFILTWASMRLKLSNYCCEHEPQN